MIVKPVGLM